MQSNFRKNPKNAYQDIPFYINNTNMVDTLYVTQAHQQEFKHTYCEWLVNRYLS